MEPYENLLDELQENYLKKIGIYHEERSNFSKEGTVLRRQTGVVRTNCIDCLDRTNVAKMMIC